MAAQLEDKLGLSMRIVAGSGGEFEVMVNGQLIYSKLETGEFPDEQALLGAIEQLA